MKLNLSFSQTAITVNNIIKLYAADDTYPNGRQIYTGIIGSLIRVNETGYEYIELRAIGIGSMLNYAYYTDTGSYAFSKNQDPKTTIKAIADNFLVQYPGALSYVDGTTLELYGSNISTSFSYDKRDEAIKKVASLTTYFWTVDGEAKLQFHPKTGGIGMLTHSVTIGKDIDILTVEENTERVVNTYFLDYTSSSTSASDATSITANGVREFHETKSEINAAGTATIRANTYIAQNKDKKYKISLTVNSNYDIESIRPGDLLTVKNLDFSISSLQINRIEYTPNNIRIELEAIDSFSKEIFT